MSVASVLGAILLNEFTSSYSSGTWSKSAASHASSQNFTQSTANLRPTAGTTQSGATTLQWDYNPIGTADAIQGGGVGGLPGSYGTGDYIFAMLAKFLSGTMSDAQQIWRSNNDTQVNINNADGKFAITGSSISNASVRDDTFHTFIVIGNSTNTRMWLDGVQQSTTLGGTLFGGPAAWAPGGSYSAFEFGCHNAGTGFESGALNAIICNPVWGWQSTSIDTTTIANLHAALSALNSIPTVQTSASGPAVLRRMARIYDRESGG